MKIKAWPRIIGIGVFHAALYLYFVPFVIYPKFGHNGFILTVVLAILISVAIFGTQFINKQKGDEHD